MASAELAGTSGDADHGPGTTPEKTGPRRKAALRSALTKRPRPIVALGAAVAAVIAAGIINRHSWNWGDFPTWVLAAGAVVTSVFAIRAFRKQSAELTLLTSQAEDQRETNRKLAAAAELQVTELKLQLIQREREAAERRQAQASKVNAWFGRSDEVDTPEAGKPLGAWGAVISNDSDLPVLNIAVSFWFINAESKSAERWTATLRGGIPERIRIMPPHKRIFRMLPDDIRDKHHECSDEVYAAGIEFTDAYGRKWERSAFGTLLPVEGVEFMPA